MPKSILGMFEKFKEKFSKDKINSGESAEEIEEKTKIQLGVFSGFNKNVEKCELKLFNPKEECDWRTELEFILNKGGTMIGPVHKNWGNPCGLSPKTDEEIEAFNYLAKVLEVIAEFYDNKNLLSLKRNLENFEICQIHMLCVIVKHYAKREIADKIFSIVSEDLGVVVNNKLIYEAHIQPIIHKHEFSASSTKLNKISKVLTNSTEDLEQGGFIVTITENTENVPTTGNGSLATLASENLSEAFN